MRDAVSVQHVVISGCSGGGKSTLLAELARRGFTTVCEPGRRIVAMELCGTGRALPCVDLAAFARRAIDLAAEDRAHVGDKTGWVFFDRGLVDAAVALQHATGQAAADVLALHEPYYRSVFLTPPWPEIYVNDDERPHALAEAIAEYERLLVAYCALGYDTIVLPKIGVVDRADIVLSHII
jgi:predicted ATPase